MDYETTIAFSRHLCSFVISEGMFGAAAVATTTIKHTSQ